MEIISSTTEKFIENLDDFRLQQNCHINITFTFEGTAKMSYLYIYEMLVASNETVYKEIELVQSIIKKKECHSLSIKNKVVNIQNKQKNNRKTME